MEGKEGNDSVKTPSVRVLEKSKEIHHIEALWSNW